MGAQESRSTPLSEVSVSALGKRVASLSKQINDFLEGTSSPQPTFEANGGEVPDDPEYESLRAALNDAALDLLSLVNGPKTTIRQMVFSHYDLAAMQVAIDRGFFKHIPLPTESSGGESEVQEAKMSVAEIANKSGMDKNRTQALLKLLATHHIFEQVDSGKGGDEYFKHTAISASLARWPDWHALADMKLDDMFKASSELSSLITRSPDVSGADQSAFHHRFGMPVYEYHEKYPQKGKRFGQAMSAWSKVNERDNELRDSFSWASLGSGKVVDVGGGSGHISIKLAREFPSLRFVVQDNSPVQLSQDQQDVAGRVSFERHDFFKPQPIHDASVFFLRQILHNYNDEDCVKIIRALVPALESCGPETSVLINDIVLPESGTVTRFEEHLSRQIDISMLVLFGAKQRSQRDWARLFNDADPRFQIVRVHRNPLGVGLVQVRLRK
ncbi:putative O-methyltransferase [Xylariaceae sp. FL1272]|nr:putative O-methyltransferase [Xylariaceae sp. FL1272]